jgi:lipoprotein-anchoring transpeptidase ErfK/SrfK
MKKSSSDHSIHISIACQELTLKAGREVVARYPVSTSRFGIGTEKGSFKTPTGRFRIAEKIGEGMPVGTVFKSRRVVTPTDEMLREDDLIMGRILWLEGLDPENANTHERYIYIHGTNHEDAIGTAASEGCIRMRGRDLVELFDRVSSGTPVAIRP